MPPGRPRKYEPRHTPFTAWWEKLVRQHPAATPELLAEVTGVQMATVRRWLDGSMSPNAEKAVRYTVEATLDATTPAPQVRPKDPDADLAPKGRQIIQYVRWLMEQSDKNDKFRKRERIILEALSERPWERTPTPLRNQPKGRSADGAPRAVGE